MESKKVRSCDYLKLKFRAWAEKRGLVLQRRDGESGERNYTATLDENMFELLSPDAREEFEAGAGDELESKMRALHSSSAMAVNLFHYWKKRGLFSEVSRSLKIPSSGIKSISFEKKYPVIENPELYGFKEPPHLDVGIDYFNGSRVGIECKLSEPYRESIPHKLAERYLALSDAWSDIPHIRELAGQLSTGNEGFNRLGPTQLIRHILGLKMGLTKDRFRLIYLYLNSPGDEAAEHRAELDRFQTIMHADHVQFIPMTVQEFIFRSVKLYRDEHCKYIDYLSERYA